MKRILAASVFVFLIQNLAWSADTVCRPLAAIFAAVTVTIGNQKDSPSEDRAGKTGVFKSGKGAKNKDPRDFVFSLESREALGVTAMSILHNVCGEGWSTSSTDRLAGQELYPLVVYQDGTPLVSKHNTPFTAAYGAGPLRLFAQPESPVFKGGVLRVLLQDGCEYRIPLGVADECALSASGKGELARTRHEHLDPSTSNVEGHVAKAPPKLRQAKSSLPTSGVSVSFVNDAASEEEDEEEEAPAPAPQKSSATKLKEQVQKIRSGSSFVIINCATEYCP
jgi:hypothetical protein